MAAKKSTQKFTEEMEEEGLATEFEFGKVDIASYDPISELIPKGWYQVTVETCETGTSGSGYATRTLRLKLDDVPENGEYANRSVFHTLSAHPNAKGMIMKTLVALNFPDDYAGALAPEDFLDRKGMARIDIEPGDEQYDPRNRVRQMKQLADGVAAEAIL